VAKLIFFAIMSLDGYIEDADGSFAWLAPDEEVSGFINGLQRPVGTYLYGRRMYETMTYWENVEGLASEPTCVQDFAYLWRAANKIVYSTTLAAVSSSKTLLERAFDPTAIRAMKSAEDRDIAMGGPNLAAQALGAGLVDECQFFLAPISVGSGKPALPTDLRCEFELVSERTFESGVVYLHYRVVTSDAGSS
jgi:dihydrofolate reductase